TRRPRPEPQPAGRRHRDRQDRPGRPGLPEPAPPVRGAADPAVRRAPPGDPGARAPHLPGGPRRRGVRGTARRHRTAPRLAARVRRNPGPHRAPPLALRPRPLRRGGGRRVPPRAGRELPGAPRPRAPPRTAGLTATPERADGVNVQDAFFDGRIAAELRLWEALDNDLLSPFHYFGVTDTTDLSGVPWRRGDYAADALDRLFTGNDARARLVLRAVRDKVADPHRMRALGFCVSVAHAEYMAEFFRRAGLNARALSGKTPERERREVLDGLRGGTVQAVFSVDLFNEGVDLPDVDTLLLLRPTSSATVFLQQLGRGLRRTPDKAVLTVLDLVGQHRREFRFENRFRALTNLTRRRLVDAIERDFPHLPSGCQIVLEPKAKETVLANIRERIALNARQLVREIRDHGTTDLGEYLAESGHDITEVYRSKRSWTGLLRLAGLLPGPAPAGEAALLRRVTGFLHVDDPVRAAAYTRLLADDAPDYADLDEGDRAFARMLFFSLWPNGGGFATYQEGLDRLRRHPAVRDELRQVVAYGLAHTRHVPVPLLLDTAPGLPLAVHASYSREEILSALGQSRLGGGLLPANFREGVRWCPDIATDALLITLDKDEKDFSPQTRYR